MENGAKGCEVGWNKYLVPDLFLTTVYVHPNIHSRL